MKPRQILENINQWNRCTQQETDRFDVPNLRQIQNYCDRLYKKGEEGGEGDDMDDDDDDDEGDDDDMDDDVEDNEDEGENRGNNLPSHSLIDSLKQDK